MLTISQLSQFLINNQANFEIIQHTRPILSAKILTYVRFIYGLPKKSFYHQKTPPSLRATSSINRGGAGDFSRRQGAFQLSICL